MKQNRKGISLIVLVITIIVMIVLAAAVVIALDNSGVIEKSNAAAKSYNLAQVKTLTQLAWAEAYAGGARTVDELQDAVDLALNANNLTGVYEATATLKGVDVMLVDVPDDWKDSVSAVTEDGAPIPVGFVKSPYDGEGKVSGGLVIYALTADEISKNEKDIITKDGEKKVSLQKRNQFVWVPVENFERDFVRKDRVNSTSILSDTIGSTDKYWEISVGSNNLPLDSSVNISAAISPVTLAEATAMYASVKKYGGFYIARYEVGGDQLLNDGETSGGDFYTRYGWIGRGNTSVTMAKYPYNAIARGSLEVENSNNAIGMARAFYPSDATTYGVASTLTYGVQWDATLTWWETLDSTFNFTTTIDKGIYYKTNIDGNYLNEDAKRARYYEYDANCEEAVCGDYFASYQEAEGREPEVLEYLYTTGAYEKANIYNIYDMAGNLAEMTMETQSNKNEWEEEIDYNYYAVMRGGSFRDQADISGTEVKSVAGYRTISANSDATYIGFRPSLYIK